MNYLEPFNGADPSPILSALYRGCVPEQVISILFKSQTTPVCSTDCKDQWIRLKGIIGCQDVYNAFDISTLSIDPPAAIYYSKGLEVIGTLGNFLVRASVHTDIVENDAAALRIARTFTDAVAQGRHGYSYMEAYSLHEPWCNWFIGDNIIDETIVLGYRNDWWVLAVTSTD